MRALTRAGRVDSKRIDGIKMIAPWTRMPNHGLVDNKVNFKKIVDKRYFLRLSPIRPQFSNFSNHQIIPITQ